MTGLLIVSSDLINKMMSDLPYIVPIVGLTLCAIQSIIRQNNYAQWGRGGIAKLTTGKNSVKIRPEFGAMKAL